MRYPYRISYYFRQLGWALLDVKNRQWYDARRELSEFFDLFCYHPRMFRYGIQNLWRWKDVIWNDRQWDYVYLYHIMKRKLELWEHDHRKYSYHENSHYEADEMEICIRVLNRLIEDDYCKQDFKKHEELFGKYGMPILTPRTDEQIKDFKSIMEKEELLRNQDTEFIFTHIKEHHRGWWD